MICQYGKRFALFAVLFLLLSLPTLSAEVCLSDETYDAIMTAVENSEREIDAQWIVSNQLRSILIQQEETQAMLSSELATSWNTIETQNQTLAKRDAYYEKREKQQRRENVKTGIVVAVVSAALGFVGGLTISLL